MTEESFKRKLAAIVSADVEGYSRLMGEDDEATIRTLTAYRALLSARIQKHRGRVVDSPGDNLLAEFLSVVDAVGCAVEIQAALAAKNAELPENRRMAFRIGINLGDVIEEDGRIYGDGVNIAARIEGLAEAGGICVARNVYDQVENRLPLEYEYLGEHAVKNIAAPVRVYRIKLAAAAGAPESGRADRFSDRPSIAVLPFVNMSGDPEQEYFSDGLTEDLITDLSKISGLFVIARNSVFTYKNNPVKVQQVAADLGVRHVLEGSVRKAGDRVRITAQLVDATTGGHLWAERYDRNLSDIFALQDEVTREIVTALAVRLGEAGKPRLVRRHTENVLAYDYFLRGVQYKHHFSKAANAHARQMFEKAIDLDAGYAIAYAKSGWTHLVDWMMGWDEDTGALARALGLAAKAVATDDTLILGYCLMGNVYLWKKEHDRALALYEKVKALEPVYADELTELGSILNFSGRPEEAIELIKNAMQFDPLFPAFNLFHLGHAYFLTGRYEDAVISLTSALSINPDFFPTRFYLAATYIALGLEDKAGAEVTEILRQSPESSIAGWTERLPYKDPAVLEHLCDSLGRAGLR